MTKTLFAALAALTIAASPALAESEQLHDGSITPTYSGGFVGQKSGEAGGGFDAASARPLYTGAFAQEVHANEGRVRFDLSAATKVGAAGSQG